MSPFRVLILGVLRFRILKYDYAPGPDSQQPTSCAVKGHERPRRLRQRSIEMLKNSNVSRRIPAQDRERARTFYRDKLGLTALEKGLAVSAIAAEADFSLCSSRPTKLPAAIPRWRGTCRISSQ